MLPRIVTYALIFSASLMRLAEAETALPGVRFDVMPVGCLIHSQYGDGTEWIEAFVGKKGQRYVTKTYLGPAKAGKLNNLISTITYDANGFMIKRLWSTGKWESFEPYSCFSKPGACSYTYRNADGSNEKYIGKVVKKGKRVVSSGGFEGSPPFADTVFDMGPFNNIDRFREGGTTYKVTSYENCGLGS